MFDADFVATMAAMGQDPSPALRLDEAVKAYADDIKLYQGIAKSINLQAQ
jgi:hypothetical protein